MSKKKEYVENPKLKGSNIVDCIPHTGECPNKCPECFYNGGRFFREMDTPWIPSLKQVGDKIVRVNSGHDSNIKRAIVLRKTKNFLYKFYNTSLPKFDFNEYPVVFTCNGGKNEDLKLVDKLPKNIMFVRVRVKSWDIETVDKAVDYYLKKNKIPVVLTFMRFYNHKLISWRAWNDYEEKKHITNVYFCPKPEMVLRVMKRYEGTGVRVCGTPSSSYCADCRNCEFFYWETLRKLGRNI